MKATGIIVLILVIFAAAVLAEVWRELHCFKITRYRIRTSKMKVDAGKVRIAFLSDLHNHVYGKENEELLLAIREAKPDLILAGGDMLVGKAYFFRVVLGLFAHTDTTSLIIQIYRVLGALLDKLLTRLHLLAHEDGERGIGLHRVIQRDAP